MALLLGVFWHISISIVLFFTVFAANSQIIRGTLINGEIPKEISTIITQDSINLKELRELTDLLTNPDRSTYEPNPTEDPIETPKRKKAFIRHIKHISESLEYAYFSKKIISTIEYECVYELLLFKKAMLADGISNNPNFREKTSLYFTTKLSKKHFHYPLPKTSNTTENYPKNSPYWHQNISNIPPHKRFEELEKLKKIKPRKNMVVLFDKLSYSGSAPKIRTMDLDLDNEWSLKWGDEVHTDVVGSRIFAALGYDVDHPYFYGRDALTLIFDDSKTVKNGQALIDSISEIYAVDLNPFVSSTGKISAEMIEANQTLAPFINQAYMRFNKCGIEARPDRVKRIGPFMGLDESQDKRIELRGALLAHAFIDNWDTRTANTLFTTIHAGNYNYRMSAVFSDLGTSFGVKINPFSSDFKVGQVNEFDWEVAALKQQKVRLNYRLNNHSEPYKKANYSDLKWMAQEIALLDEKTLRYILEKSGWPMPLKELYFHKLASRRASILKAFGIEDPNPIEFSTELTIEENGKTIVKSGKLITDYQRDQNPESFLKNKGRFRNYGN